MTTSVRAQTSFDRQNLTYVLIGTLLLGSIWGVSEVALGGALKAAQFPYRSGLLTGIGMGTMAVALAMFRKPLPLLGIGIIAVAVKLLVVPVLHVSPLCQANSCLAVGIEASSLAFLSFLATGPLTRNWFTLMVGGAVAALVASGSFFFLGMRLAPCAYLQSFNATGFVAREGLVWAAFSAALFPAGYAIGKRFLAGEGTPVRRTSLYYGASVAGIVLSWGVSTAAIAAGF